MREEHIEPGKVSKENFIDFLVHATPQDLNELIALKGKPRKPYCPIYIFRNPEGKDNEISK